MASRTNTSQPHASAPGAPGAFADTAVVTDVPASVTSVTLAAANPDRYALFIYNMSSSNLYVKFGTGATNSLFTALIPANTLLDLVPPVAYTGEVTGVWDAATGSALVTEVD